MIYNSINIFSINNLNLINYINIYFILYKISDYFLFFISLPRWSSGEDFRLSRERPGFNSRTGSLFKWFYLFGDQLPPKWWGSNDSCKVDFRITHELMLPCPTFLTPEKIIEFFNQKNGSLGSLWEKDFVKYLVTGRLISSITEMSNDQLYNFLDFLETKKSTMSAYLFEIGASEMYFIFKNYSNLRLIFFDPNNDHHHMSPLNPEFGREFVQNFKISSIELIQYFWDKLIQLRKKIKEIIGVEWYERFCEIKEYHLYYYLFKKSINDCDIETLKKIDQLGFVMHNQELNYKQVPLKSKTFSSKLYQDQNSRKQLLNYLTSTGFKNFIPDLFVKYFSTLLYSIDQNGAPYEKTILEGKSEVVEFYSIFTDQEIEENRSLINLKLNETLFYQLLLDSIYKLNLPILNFLLHCDVGIQINPKKFLNLISNDEKTYSFIIDESSLISNNRYDTILKIIKLLFSKLPKVDKKKFPIQIIYKYLYKAIIQSKDSTIDKIKNQVHPIYQEHSIEINIDYFNIYYWFTNKSKKFSLYFISLYHTTSDLEYFSNLTEATKNPASNLIRNVLKNFNFSMFDFNLISIATFDYLLERLGRIKIFLKNALFFFSIFRNDIYIKTLKDFLLQYSSSHTSMDANDQAMAKHFTSQKIQSQLLFFIRFCQNVEEIKEILDIKSQFISYGNIFEYSVSNNNFFVFKYLIDNYKKENLKHLDLASVLLLNSYGFIKYAIEKIPNQVEQSINVIQ
ncbi:hypothetical protein DICPUDRAFT_77931 [Dictyostelium purpureum]|uniref:Uncharacterized protein n=1 Tax=Dictyostelium purpureum TaxID=5786 RepID=F0ZI23_DICPU|nr:uncharacterized protein DICPUDRAFT_77931 [Dictyostelium purpureum]EGC36418.1 hypothetical protein DICPUDRAFT_77931 [Dictyostelium purpureum]|eukprot:XP_003287051.1 hypothetical protein DICPUDRAFT_77931 [Dictyostelium purpureum]